MSNRIAVVTDSSIGLLQKDVEHLGITVIPMTIIVDGAEYQDGINISTANFVERQIDGAKIGTSLPSPGYVQEVFEKLLESHDEVIYMPMTSGMSGTYNSGVLIAGEFNGKVTVIDTKQITYGLYYNVLRAKHLIEQGLSSREIKEILEKIHESERIYVCTETLEYLKRGGRIPASAATIGGLLKIKPIMIYTNGNIELSSVQRTMTKAVKTMVDNIIDSIPEDDRLNYVYYTSSFQYDEYPDLALSLIKERYPDAETVKFPITSLVINHTGQQAMALGVAKKF